MPSIDSLSPGAQSVHAAITEAAYAAGAEPGEDVRFRIEGHRYVRFLDYPDAPVLDLVEALSPGL